MNLASAERFSDYDDPGKWSSAALAVLMHGLLVAALFISVRWQTHHEPIVAELWVPSPPVITAPPPPEPAPVVPPEPVRVEPPPPPKPDIAIKPPKAKPAPKPKAKPKSAPKPVPQTPPAQSFDALLARDAAQIDRMRLERGKLERSAQEADLLAQNRAAMEAQSRDRALDRDRADYVGRLKGKISGNLVQPPSLKGNPTARFRVTQLPNGEVLDVRLVSASGNGFYDDAIERAIRKSSPLPLPNDRSLFARDLDITYCPDPDASGRCPR